MNISLRHSLRGWVRLSALAGGLFALGATSAHAQTYNVSLNTTGLNSGDSYAVDLQLNQGGSTPNSTVNVGSFLFGGGSPGPNASIQTSGIASGSLSSAVALGSSTASSFNGFMQDFNNRSNLGFTVNAAQLAAAAGGTSDQFLFDLYDNTTGASVTTNDTVTGGNFALFTLTRGADGAYTTHNFGYTSAGGTTFTTTSAPSATPELGTLTSLGLLMGLFGLGALRARRGQARTVAIAE